jgi:ketosteroid isomerase-like protein
MKANDQTAREIQTALEAYRTAFERRDLEAITATLTPDPDVIIVGTGPDEILVGREAFRSQVQRDWKQADETSWQWEYRSIGSAGPVAWALIAGALQARFGSLRLEMPLRITAVLELRGDRWLIAHLHISAPAPGQAEGESYPTL